MTDVFTLKWSFGGPQHVRSYTAWPDRAAHQSARPSNADVVILCYLARNFLAGLGRQSFAETQFASVILAHASMANMTFVSRVFFDDLAENLVVGHLMVVGPSFNGRNDWYYVQRILIQVCE
ncbi:hypothetical protein [Fibrobacter sp.]|uniref:hypothetical protein n=1 Tax=Fibrobacter sp. TaxID=35828 RepID=UPI0025C413B9|nr:hypothetical protein [Fibrobacter sp.]MBS7272275.1 hypothetical protein [Fibrobacter sp.]MDD7498704.1 hypothetical protein [Fibrobacter sp.]MDY5724844.1 hypothetical protein [Fibrobacter sp.]